MHAVLTAWRDALGVHGHACVHMGVEGGGRLNRVCVLTRQGGQRPW